MRSTIVAAIPALALALSACAGTGVPSGGGGSERQTGAQTEEAPTSDAPEAPTSDAPEAPTSDAPEAPTSDAPEAPAGTTPGASPDTTLETAPSTTPQPSGAGTSSASQEPVASQEFDLDGRRMTVAITQLRREGRTTTLNFTITHEDGAAWRIGNDLGGSVTDYTVGGVSLVDTGNAKRYRPGRTGNRKCLCSETSGGRRIEPGRSYPFYAMYAAPPPEVTKVHIEIPQFGIMTDVPIS